MKEITIEIYTDNYKDEVAGLILNIQNNEFGIPITLEMQPDLKMIPAYYQINNGNFWIARKGDEIIGTISLLDIGDHKAALRKMFVNQNFRGKKFSVGQMLLETLHEWTRNKGFTEIYLGTTDKFIGAQRFYKKNGYIEIPRKELPGSFPVMEVDSKFYRYSI